MPVRSPSNWGGNIIGSFPSLKNGQPVPYESTIERDLIFFLEYDHTVLHYEMQPFTITSTNQEGVTQRYTPDVQVIRASSIALIECKPAALVRTPSAQQQIAIGQQWADVHSRDFVVVTDENLRTGHQLANLKLLWRYARIVVAPNITARCRSILSKQPQPFRELAQHLADTPGSLQIAPQLYHLLFRRILHTDLEQPLTVTSLIQLSPLAR